MSLVARQEGVSAELLFQWRDLERRGALATVSAGEAVLPASEQAAVCVLISTRIFPSRGLVASAWESTTLPFKQVDMPHLLQTHRTTTGARIGYKSSFAARPHQSTMNRAELVEILAIKNDLSKAAANAILETLIETVQTAVKKGDAVQLVGFGTFKSAKRAARSGKNPATGAALKIPASTVPKFVPGAKFKAVVDPKAAKRKAEKAGK